MPLDQRTIQLLAKYLPDFQPIPLEKEAKEASWGYGWTTLSLPIANGADYGFSLHEYNGDQYDVSASLLNPQDSTKRHFWHISLEVLDKSKANEVFSYYLQLIEVLLCHETRIEQQKGLLFGSLRCDYLDEELWKKVGSVSFFRYLIHGPTISGRSKIYRSPAVSDFRMTSAENESFTSKRTHSIILGSIRSE